MTFGIRHCLKQSKVLLIILMLDMKYANFLIMDLAQALLDLILYLRARVTHAKLLRPCIGGWFPNIIARIIVRFL